MTISVVNVIASFLILLGKIVITAGCTTVAYLMIDNGAQYKEDGATPVHSYVMPLLFVAVVSYGIGSLFLMVYGMGIETIIMGFCIDKDENSEGTYMFPQSLARAIGMGDKTRKAKAEQENNLSKDNASEASNKYGSTTTVTVSNGNSTTTVVTQSQGDGDFI